MTYTSLKQLNDNQLYAPIGHEEAFKRRIFLDNFNRCLTVRAFQKTAGLEIKKKLTETPSAKCINRAINKYKSNQPDGEFSWSKIRRRRQGISEKTILKTCKSYYTTKNGKTINSRKKRVEEAISEWTRKIKYIRYPYHPYELLKAKEAYGLLRVGFYNYMDSWKKEYTQPYELIHWQHFWVMLDDTERWANCRMVELYNMELH